MNIEKLWVNFHAPLRGFVAKRVSNHFAVDDIVQDVFIKIIKHITELKDEQKIHAWIYKITKSTIIDYYRKQKTTEELPEDLKVNEEHYEEDLSTELAACIQPMIDQLPEKYKEAVQLTEINGMLQKDLSTHLGISISGTKSRVQRGRQKLKNLLTACCDIEADVYGNIIDYKQLNQLNNANQPNNANNSSKTEVSPCKCN